MAAQEQLNEMRERHGWDTEVLLAAVAVYIDEMESFWTTPSLPGTKPKPFSAFLGELEHAYAMAAESKEAEEDLMPPPSENVESIEVIESPDNPRAPRLFEEVPEGAEEQTAYNLDQPAEQQDLPAVIHARAEVSQEFWALAQRWLGKPADSTYNQNFFIILAPFPGTDVQARVRMVSGCKCWVMADLWNSSNAKSLHRLTPRYDRLEGEYVFPWDGREYILTLTAPS